MKVCTCSDAARRHGIDAYGRLHRGPCLRPGCGCPAFVFSGDAPIVAARPVPPAAPRCALCARPATTATMQLVELDGRQELVHADCWALRSARA